MKTSFGATNANEMEFSMTITMKLKDWMALSKQLVHEWPSHLLSNEITDMVNQASSRFYPQLEDKE